jgi:hypothetical protein
LSAPERYTALEPDSQQKKDRQKLVNLGWNLQVAANRNHE